MREIDPGQVDGEREGRTALRYIPQDYWRALHARHDISAVGQSTLPPEINGWLYRTLARNYGRFARQHGLTRPAPARVYDVGAGTGFWVAWWLRRGARQVDGCDLVPEAVQRLEQRFDGRPVRIAVADVSDPAGLGTATYDLVSCQNVLLHVTDDQAFARALSNVARLVAPGGLLLLTEPILRYPAYERPYTADLWSRARPLDGYAAPLAAAGLELVALRAATVLGNNPIESKSPWTFRSLTLWWRVVVKCSRVWPGSAGILGRLIYVLDPIALRTGAMPTSKFALFRRPADASPDGRPASDLDVSAPPGRRGSSGA